MVLITHPPMDLLRKNLLRAVLSNTDILFYTALSVYIYIYMSVVYTEEMWVKSVISMSIFPLEKYHAGSYITAS